MKIHVFGDTSKEKIILLHPMFSSGKRMYEMFKEDFSDYCIIAPDISGHGEDTTDYISAKWEGDILLTFLLKNGFKDIKLLYGMSLGARIVLELMNEKEINCSLIYMDGAPAYKDSKMTRLYYVPLFLGKIYSDKEKINFLTEKAESLNMKTLLPEKIRNYGKLSKKAFKAMIIDCSKFDFPEVDRKIQEKTVFDYGSLEPDKRCIRELKNNYPYAKYMLRNGYGHCQYAEKKRRSFMAELKNLLHNGAIPSTDYRSWMPDLLTDGLMLGTAAISATSGILSVSGKKKAAKFTCIASIMSALLTLDAVRMKYDFDMDRKDSLAREILETCASMVNAEPGAEILDIGCGSGAFGIAVKKRNPDTFLTGVDTFRYAGDDYFTEDLCYRNAEVEGVTGVRFLNDDARSLSVSDESYDIVISNYVIHNIPGDKRKYIMEALRCVKPGGTFLIHDLFSKWKYGDVFSLMDEIKAAGFSEVDFVRTDNDNPIPKVKGFVYGLRGSGILYGKK